MMLNVLESFFPSLSAFTDDVKSSIVNFFVANRDNTMSLTVAVPKDTLIEMLAQKKIVVGPKLKQFLDTSNASWWVDAESIDSNYIRIYTTVSRGNSDLHDFLKMPKQEISEFVTNKLGVYYDTKSDSVIVKKEYFLVKTENDGRVYHQFKYNADNTFVSHTKEIFASDESAFKGSVELVKALKSSGVVLKSSYRTDNSQTYLHKSKK